jgi:hypothetical protein
MTRALLHAEVARLLPTNGVGAITAENLRTVFDDIIDAPDVWAAPVPYAEGIDAQEDPPRTVVVYQEETYIVAAGAGSFVTGATFDASKWTKIASRANIASTDALPEGATNKYFTEARVRDTALTGLSTASAADVTASDDILAALGKLQAKAAADAAALALKAPLASPTFTGTVAVPVPLPSDNSTQPASTSWVTAKIAAATAGVSSVNGRSGVVTLDKTDVSLSNVDNTSDASKPVSTAQATAIAAKISTSAIGAASGVAPLDGSSKVPAANLPDTGSVAEGTNKYFTEARVRATVLTGLSTATNAAITATDDVLGAAGKLQAQLNGLGTAASKNVGTSALNVVQLDASAKLPVVDGSQLTGISPAMPVRAWAQFTYPGSGSSATIDAGGNMASISRSAAGNYTLSFTSALPSGNYVVVGMFGGGLTYTGSMRLASATSGGAPTLKTTGQVQIYCNAAAGVDVSGAVVAIIGG